MTIGQVNLAYVLYSLKQQTQWLFILQLESGVSPFACAENYPGPEPDSEVEVRNIRAYFESIQPQPSIAVCFHSASELWLYPYGYDYNQYQDNVEEVVRRQCR